MTDYKLTDILSETLPDRSREFENSCNLLHLWILSQMTQQWFLGVVYNFHESYSKFYTGQANKMSELFQFSQIFWQNIWNAISTYFENICEVVLDINLRAACVSQYNSCVINPSLSCSLTISFSKLATSMYWHAHSQSSYWTLIAQMDGRFSGSSNYNFHHLLHAPKLNGAFR